MTQPVTTTDLHAPARAALPDAAVVSTTIRNARTLPPDALTRATLAAYNALRARLDALGDAGRHVVRMWNFIPGITELLAPGLERYMAFNAGRFEAMCHWYGGAEALPRHAPAASGVGCAGDDIVIHAMALPTPGIAIQNPRQTPAMHYSERYGPRPPCFARGTRVGDLLLISGTAAITGEESICLNDLDGQIAETVQNLRTLVQTAFGDRPARMQTLRAYLPNPQSADAVDRVLRQAFTQVESIEYVHAALCRRELLVEVEGVAEGL